MPGNYDTGYFDSCLGDTGLPMGIYGTSTFHQGDGHTPAPHPAPASSSCYRLASLTSHSPVPSGASVYSTVTVVGTGKSKYASLITSVALANTNTVSSTASSRAAGSSPTTSSLSSNGALRGSGGSIWAGFAVVVGVLAGAIAVL